MPQASACWLREMRKQTPGATEGGKPWLSGTVREEAKRPHLNTSEMLGDDKDKSQPIKCQIYLGAEETKEHLSLKYMKMLEMPFATMTQHRGWLNTRLVPFIGSCRDWE